MPLYKTWDRFATLDFLRPASGFDAEPVGAVSRMINISAAGLAPANGFLRMCRDEHEVREWNGLEWGEIIAPVGGEDPLLRLLHLENGHMVALEQTAGTRIFHAAPGASDFLDTTVAPASRAWMGEDIAADGRMFALAVDDVSSGGGQATKPATVYVSTDYGVTWTALFSTAGYGGRNHASAGGVSGGRWLTCDPNNADRIAFAVREENGANQEKLIIAYTEDGGDSWTVGAPVDGGFNLGTTFGGTLMFADNGRLIFQNYHTWGAQASRMFYSDNLGQSSWTQATGVPNDLHSFALARYNSAAAGRLVFNATGPSTNNSLTYISRTNGQTWELLNNDTDFRGAGGVAYDTLTDRIFTSSATGTAAKQIANAFSGTPVITDISNGLSAQPGLTAGVRFNLSLPIQVPG